MDKREQSKQRQQRYRDNQKRNASVTNVTQDGSVTKECNDTPLPTWFGQSVCECKHCRNNRDTRDRGSRHVINHGPYKSAGELKENELNRVPLPGDIDYEGAA